MNRTRTISLQWQSKAVLLLVLPMTCISVMLQSYGWAKTVPAVAWTALGISGIFGLIVWRLRAGTARAAWTGAAITASLMYSTTQFPYQYSWMHGSLLPLLALFLLTFLATRIGKAKKQRLGLNEDKQGRNAAQVAANLGAASLVALPVWGLILGEKTGLFLGFLMALAALAEAAADTCSSEIGEALGGTPRMLTTLRRVQPGEDGGVTLVGTAAGVLAAVVVAETGIWAFAANGIFTNGVLVALVSGAATIGFLCDSLLGATLERRGWLNNDAVNFVSTLIAALCVFGGFWYLASLIVV